MSLRMPASPGILDSGHVVLSGPTPKTVTVTPGATVTITGLDPGTYTVALIGFYGGGAAYTAQVSGVSVVAGQNATPAVPALVASFGVTVTPPTASIAPGATQQFAAVAKDGQGTTLNGITFYWASSNQNAALVDQTGLATGVAGGTVTISALGLGVPGNAALTVTDAVPTQLAFSSQPTSSIAGNAFSPAVQVEVRDANGNRVSTSRSAVTLAIGTNPGSGTLNGTATVNAVNGVASFSGLYIDKVGTDYTLATSSSGLSGATSSGFNISPAAPAKLTFTAQPSNAEGNVVISPAVAVTILDRFDNVVTGATNSVTLLIDANPWAAGGYTGGSLSGTVTVAASSGVATFSAVRVDKPGSGYTLAAASGTLTGATSATFNIHLTMQSVTAGHPYPGYHSCGIAAGGTYCWGYNFYGQLGAPTGFSNNDPVPALVRGGLTFTQVTAGAYHSCAITAAGAAYCWGFNQFGQLGDNTTTNRATPVLVQAPAGVTFTLIEAGYEHTCARASNGDLYCWGSNSRGQVGDNSIIDRHAPVKVGGPVVGYATVNPGYQHTCAVDANGNANCWGSNGNGQLGDNTTVDKLIPTATATAQKFTSVSAGYAHTCGVTVGNAGYCWGYNVYGQLGDGTTTQQLVPTPVTGGIVFATISTGLYHSCGAATSATGKAGWCWGYNGAGQLGDGTTNNAISGPVTVAGGLLFDSMRSGYQHTCGRVGTDAYCWGNNNFGGLGDASFVNKSSPVKIVQ